MRYVLHAIMRPDLLSVAKVLIGLAAGVNASRAGMNVILVPPYVALVDLILALLFLKYQNKRNRAFTHPMTRIVSTEKGDQ